MSALYRRILDDQKLFEERLEGKGPRMAKSIALAADASRRSSLLLSYIPAVCAIARASPAGRLDREHRPT